MEPAEARRVARTVLDGIASADVPLRLVDDADVADLGWARVYAWNTERWFATRDRSDAAGPGPGPVVVPADGEAFLLASTPSYDEQLAAYARDHGLPPPPPLGW